ncbi:MAG: FecR domain-containing protein [bacterium]|nr:FecR domain-containing protein [bacterium]
MDPTEHNAPPHPPSDDGVGELVRLVGQRPEISAERSERHRTLARAHWERKLRMRTRRRRVRIGLAAAAVLALALGLGLEWQRRRTPTTSPVIADSDGRPAVVRSSEPDQPPARPEAITEAVNARRAPGETPTAPAVENGEVLRDGTRDGTWIETGSESRAALRLASGHALRLDVDTRLRVVADAVIALERGAVYVDSHAAPAGVSVEIRTPLGVATDVGTRFELRLRESSLRVRVREGIVNVTRGGRSHEARTGAELILDEAGDVEHRSVPVYGPEWRWSLEIAPAFDIEGRTLREFLGWVSRETGWRLRFHDPAVAAGTASVILSGSIEGLTPADALAVVLPTSGLRHRVAEGVLIIEPRRGRETGG